MQIANQRFNIQSNFAASFNFLVNRISRNAKFACHHRYLAAVPFIGSANDLQLLIGQVFRLRFCCRADGGDREKILSVFGADPSAFTGDQ
jgi:hypothetical protein